MECLRAALPDVLLLIPSRHGDERGFFSETYNRHAFADLGIVDDFVQDNHSLSAQPNVVRGLHYQLAPRAQAKLVRVVRGAILDVAVDLRRTSPTFGRAVAEIISAENWRQIYIPVGFAHGFRTLEPDTEVVYKVSQPYSPQHERGIAWNDPALRVDWQIPAGAEVTLSPRDRAHPPLAEAADLF